MADTRELEAREKQELGGEQTRPGPVFRPDVDILERPEGYQVLADLPGVDEKSVDVRLERGRLTIAARPATVPEGAWTALHTEYRVGGYHREFQLSEDIDEQNVTAKMSNGVLDLTLPKSVERQPRSIEVQAG